MRISVLISYQDGDKPYGLFHKLLNSGRKLDMDLVIVEYYESKFNLPVPLGLQWKTMPVADIDKLELNEWVLDLPAFTLPVGNAIDEVLKDEQFGKTYKFGPNTFLFVDDELMNFHPKMLVDTTLTSTKVLSCSKETWLEGKRVTKTNQEAIFLTAGC